MPKSRNAEEKAPSRKYLTAASCDISRLRRASGAQQVQREREDLQRHEERQQVVGRREDQHAADREQEQREDLGGGEAGLDGGLLAVAARHGGGLRGEGVDAVAVRLRVEPALGEGEDRDERASRIVPCRNSAGRRRRSRPWPRCAPWSCRSRRPRGRPPRRRRRPGRRRTGTPGRSSGTRRGTNASIRTPDDRGAEDDQRGRQLRRTRCSAPGSCRASAAAVVHRLWTAAALTWRPPRVGLGVLLVDVGHGRASPPG